MIKISDFINFIKKHDPIIYPFAESFLKVDRSVIPHFIPSVSNTQKLGGAIWGSHTPDVYFNIRYEGNVILNHDNHKYPNTFKTFKYDALPLFREGKAARRFLYLDMSKDMIAEYILLGGQISDMNDTIKKIHLEHVTFDEFRCKTYSAEVQCGTQYSHMIEKIKLKVLKHYVDIKTPVVLVDKYKDLKHKYDMDFIKILMENSVDDGGFRVRGSSDKSKPLFEIKIQGFSNIPKISDVLDRDISGKKQTTAGVLVSSIIKKIDAENKSVDELLKEIEICEASIYRIGMDVKKQLYGMFLDKVWFEEYTDFGDQEYSSPTVEYKIIHNG